MSSLQKENPNFTIYSRDRILGDVNDFSYRIQLVNGYTYDLACITRITIPKCYYTISNNNDSFILHEGLLSETVIIEHGYYNVCNFPPVLQEALNLASPNEWTYKVNYNKRNHKLEINVYNDNGITQPIFDFSNTYIGQQMGFKTRSSDQFVDNYLESYYTVNFQKTQYISLVSDIMVNNGSLDSEANTVLRIPVENFPDGSMIEYEIKHIDDQSRSVSSQISGVYYFKLIDDNGYPLELNRDYSIDLFFYEWNYYYDLQIKKIEDEQKEKSLKERNDLLQIEKSANN